ncbi:fatty acyl-AMP ligase [Lentzea sp. NPDC059081]|uniref:fatty acyl-AMP ligase n=1 Tax=Lentzea sp. NPDC059081 TaxID=3346719 RepID=UPI0036D01A84
MSRFIDTLLDTARGSARGMVTGAPAHPVRRDWNGVHARARRVAAAIAAEGMRRGCAIAVLAGEPAEVASAVQGVWLAGASVTMLHQPTPRTDLAEWSQDTVGVLTMIGAQCVLLGTEFQALGAVLGEHGMPYLVLSELLERSDPGEEFAVAAAEETDTALLQLTSGTTGPPKAVRITHGNFYTNITDIAGRLRLVADRDVTASWLPLFHDMGMIAFLAVPMVLGLELVKITPLDFLRDPLVWPALMSEYGATVTGAPGFAYAVAGKRLAESPEETAFDLSSLRIALNGAEPVDEEVMAGFVEAGARFGLRHDCVVSAYGMAEATLAVSAAPLGGGLVVDEVDEAVLNRDNRAVPAKAGTPAKRFGKLGLPLPGVEVGVMSSDGTLIGDREVGELLVRGDAVTSEYLTADGPVSAQDEQGWLHTGDLGYLADGQVVVCGRIKDVIVLDGRKFFPTDIERAAASVDGVRAGNAAAVRVEPGTERERFAVVAESSVASDPEAEFALAEQIAARVAHSVGVRPAVVRVVPPGGLPKTSSGKLRRTDAAGYLATVEHGNPVLA